MDMLKIKNNPGPRNKEVVEIANKNAHTHLTREAPYIVQIRIEMPVSHSRQTLRHIYKQDYFVRRINLKAPRIGFGLLPNKRRSFIYSLYQDSPFLAQANSPGDEL
jgi:hypothetical protein